MFKSCLRSGSPRKKLPGRRLRGTAAIRTSGDDTVPPPGCRSCQPRERATASGVPSGMGGRDGHGGLTRKSSPTIVPIGGPPGHRDSLDRADHSEYGCPAAGKLDSPRICFRSTCFGTRHSGNRTRLARHCGFTSRDPELPDRETAMSALCRGSVSDWVTSRPNALRDLRVAGRFSMYDEMAVLDTNPARD